MKYANWLMFWLFVGGLWVSGCSDSTPSTPADVPPDVPAVSSEETSTEHTHGSGPNGGVVFDFAGHHAEFTVDHAKKECTVTVLGEDEKTPLAVASTELILNTQETKTADGQAVDAMTIFLSPVDATEGKTAIFVGTDLGIGKVADFAGTVSGDVDGKPALGEFSE